MKWYYYLLGLIAVCTICSCQNSDPDAETGPYMQLEFLAGTTPNTDWNFLPYPCHFGKIESYPTLLLSKANSPGNERSIIPIGLIEFELEGDTKTWLVANDAHDRFKIEGLDNIDDLMTEHNGIKTTLERWISNQHGIGGVTLKGWAEAPSFTDSNNQ